LSEFYISYECVDGRRNTCKECMRSDKKNDTKRKLAREYAKQRRRSNPVTLMLKDARKRARKGNLLFTITKNDVKIPDICPILGVPLVVGNGMFGPSLDRINPKLGYVPNNIAVISKKANMIKNDATADEHLAVVRYMSTHDKKLSLKYQSNDKQLINKLYWGAKRRSRTLNVPCTLRKNDIKVPAICPILSIPIKRGVGIMTNNSPSLDRLDPTLGYTKENCSVISYRANRIKNDGDIKTHLRIAKYIKEFEQTV